MAMNIASNLDRYPRCPRLHQRVQAAPITVLRPEVQADGASKPSGLLGLSLQGIRDLISHYWQIITQPKPAPTPKPVTKPAAPAQGSYTVAKNDTLWGIANKKLGNGNRWREIYELNKDLIGANPDKIVPGQVLRMPGTAATPSKPKPANPPAKPSTPAKPAPKPSAGKLPDSKSYFISQYQSASNSKEDSPRNGNCGPTSLTMVAKAFGKIKVSPKTADAAIEETRRRMGASHSQYDGTSYVELVRGAHSYGLNAKVLNGRSQTIQEELKKGRLVIAHVCPNYLWPGSTSGHYTVVTKIANGKVYLNDPANAKGPTVVSEKQFLAGQKARGTFGLISIGD